MSYGTERVSYKGSTVTFHRNRSAAHRGFIYVASRRVYGTIGRQPLSGVIGFTPNAPEAAQAEPELASV